LLFRKNIYQEIIMKRYKKIIVASLISASLFASSMAVAQGWNSRGKRGMGYNQQQLYYAGAGRVLRTEMDEVRMAVLADLSGQSEEDIQSKLSSKPMWGVLEELEITYSDFQASMHDKAEEVVRQAIADNKLTEEQGNLMLKQMEEGPHMAMGSRSNGRRGMGNRGMGYRSGNDAENPGYGNANRRGLESSK
jgi:hypothetical protein